MNCFLSLLPQPPDEYKSKEISANLLNVTIIFIPDDKTLLRVIQGAIWFLRKFVRRNRKSYMRITMIRE